MHCRSDIYAGAGRCFKVLYHCHQFRHPCNSMIMSASYVLDAIKGANRNKDANVEQILDLDPPNPTWNVQAAFRGPPAVIAVSLPHLAFPGLDRSPLYKTHLST